MSRQAKRMLQFCAVTCLLLIFASYAMSAYSSGVIEHTQTNSTDLPSTWADGFQTFHHYRLQLIKAGIFFLVLWPSLVVFLIRTGEIRKYSFMFLFVPILFTIALGLLERLLFLRFGFPRQIELYYAVLLKPIIGGYVIALLLQISLAVSGRFGTKSLSGSPSGL